MPQQILSLYKSIDCTTEGELKTAPFDLHTMDELPCAGRRNKTFWSASMPSQRNANTYRCEHTHAHPKKHKTHTHKHMYTHTQTVRHTHTLHSVWYTHTSLPHIHFVYRGLLLSRIHCQSVDALKALREEYIMRAATVW